MLAKVEISYLYNIITITEAILRSTVKSKNSNDNLNFNFFLKKVNKFDLLSSLDFQCKGFAVRQKLQKRGVFWVRSWILHKKGCFGDKI